MTDVVVERFAAHDGWYKVRVTGCCRSCGVRQEEIVVRAAWYDTWRNGELIQRALPDLTPGQRELLISGTCELCWERMFNDEPD